MSRHEPMAVPAGVRLIDDLHLGQPHVIGTYLLLGDEPAIVDPGPTSTLASLEAGLAAHGVALADLRAILLTHIHLDHAGATGTIVRRHPRLRVYVHQRGAPHMIDPTKLAAGSMQVYGEADFKRLYGQIVPIPARSASPNRIGMKLSEIWRASRNMLSVCAA